MNKEEFDICWSYGATNEIHLCASHRTPRILAEQYIEIDRWRRIMLAMSHIYMEDDNHNYKRGWALHMDTMLSKRLHFNNRKIDDTVWLPYGPTLLNSALRAGYVLNQLFYMEPK